MKIIYLGKEVTLGDVVPHDDPNGVQVDVYRRVLGEDGKPTGHIYRVAGRPIVDIARDLARELERREMVDEYTALGHEFKYEQAKCPDTPADWPEDVCNVACWAVRGGSEGHYVHVDMVRKATVPGTRPQHVNIMTVKTFRGIEHARKIAAACCDMLGFGE